MVEQVSSEAGSADGNQCMEPGAVASEPGYRLASRYYKRENSLVRVRNAVFGDDSFSVIAGPCAVESFEQIEECARVVRATGGTVLRGGCFKPRTSPYSFQGLGYSGLEMLAEAGRKYDLAIVTEVMSPDDVDEVSKYADMLQVGARNMQNFSLLRAVGAAGKPVLLKRGLAFTVDELLCAAEYILAEGNPDVVLCERGIRTFNSGTRATLDISAIPLVKKLSHLPIIADPSHAAGDRELVPDLTRAIRAVGAHGVMIEVHPDPDDAKSDGQQSLGFEPFQALMAQLHD